MTERGDIRIDCRDCQFSRDVNPEYGRFLSELVVEHTDKRDHALVVSRLDR